MAQSHFLDLSGLPQSLATFTRIKICCGAGSHRSTSTRSALCIDEQLSGSYSSAYPTHNWSAPHLDNGESLLHTSDSCPDCLAAKSLVCCIKALKTMTMLISMYQLAVISVDNHCMRSRRCTAAQQACSGDLLRNVCPGKEQQTCTFASRPLTSFTKRPFVLNEALPSGHLIPPPSHSDLDYKFQSSCQINLTQLSCTLFARTS